MSTCQACNGTGVGGVHWHQGAPSEEAGTELLKCTACDGFGKTFGVNSAERDRIAALQRRELDAMGPLAASAERSGGEGEETREARIERLIDEALAAVVAHTHLKDPDLTLCYAVNCLVRALRDRRAREGEGCDCASANNPDGATPAHVCVPPGQSTSRGIDACIWPGIKALWDAGYQTQASCCGHGRMAPLVSVVIDPAKEQDLLIAYDIVRKVDARLWSLLPVAMSDDAGRGAGE